MTLEELRNLGREFEIKLKLRTKPLGLNFFKKLEDVPKEYEFINKKRAICNLVGMSRYYEIPVAVTAENLTNVCVVPNVTLGLADVPANFAQNAAGSFAKNAEEAGKILDGFLKLAKGSIAAVGVCPIEYATVMPDVVQIWGNPNQMMELEYANTWNHGDGKLVLETNGHGASCYESSIKPYLTHKLILAIADSGDKRHGMAADDDMILGVPTDMLADLYDGLVGTDSTRNRLPITYNFDDIDFPIPPYVLEHSKVLKDLPGRKGK